MCRVGPPIRQTRSIRGGAAGVKLYNRHLTQVATRWDLSLTAAVLMLRYCLLPLHRLVRAVKTVARIPSPGSPVRRVPHRRCGPAAPARQGHGPDRRPGRLPGRPARRNRLRGRCASRLAGRPVAVGRLRLLGPVVAAFREDALETAAPHARYVGGDARRFPFTGGSVGTVVRPDRRVRLHGRTSPARRRCCRWQGPGWPHQPPRNAQWRPGPRRRPLVRPVADGVETPGLPRQAS